MSDGAVTIRPAEPADFDAWAAMRTRLWPDCGPEENAADIDGFATGRSALKIVFLAFLDDRPVGFAEISERSGVDGTDYRPAAYLEGWFVAEDVRGRGIGGALVGAAATWAREKGYTYLGSDAEIENRGSHAAHEALGFTEISRVVTYVKRLGA